MSVWRPNDMLSCLEGQWSLVRHVTNLAGMSGVAVFSRRKDGLLDFAERGCLILPNGRQSEFWRRYVFAPDAAGFRVFFDESPLRLFHDVRLQCSGEGLIGLARHICGRDDYVTAYEFLPDRSFTIRHKVRGGRESYDIRSRYVADSRAF